MTQIDPRGKSQDVNQKYLPNSAFYSYGTYAEGGNLALDSLAKDLKNYGIQMKIITTPSFGFLDALAKTDALIVLEKVRGISNEAVFKDSKYSEIVSLLTDKGKVVIPLQVKAIKIA